jgi:cellulose biosynthesis protein BcsQ
MPQKTEIIAFCSGKGGTGKTVICSCLGYALTRGGHKVLMVDGDPGTDGLSLFLLGPEGRNQVGSFDLSNTFVGALQSFREKEPRPFQPRLIHRRGQDQGVSYSAVISGKALYGDEQELARESAVPDLDRSTFRNALTYLFRDLRTQGEYDYVLMDTRGGFALESTDVCALADSFIVVTEPDYTSFFQDRNLVSRISAAAKELGSPSFLRGMIVNKATDGLHADGDLKLDNLEVSFRSELTKEFGIQFSETYPIPVDIEALLAYKVQQIPYVAAPGSPFSTATLDAFSKILRIVTSQWTVEQVDHWNELVDFVSDAAEQRRATAIRAEQEELRGKQEEERLRQQLREAEGARSQLEAQLSQQLSLFESERQRSTYLINAIGDKIKDESGNSIVEPRKTLLKRFLGFLVSPWSLLILVLVAAPAVFLYWNHQQELNLEQVRSESELKLESLQRQLAGSDAVPTCLVGTWLDSRGDEWKFGSTGQLLIVLNETSLATGKLSRLDLGDGDAVQYWEGKVGSQTDFTLRVLSNCDIVESSNGLRFRNRNRNNSTSK